VIIEETSSALREALCSPTGYLCMKARSWTGKGDFRSHDQGMKMFTFLRGTTSALIYGRSVITPHLILTVTIYAL
jgi:hypothetical protein